MSRVVYLHVGAPKTGTTYLQDRLFLNRGELARHDVHYPVGIHASQFRPALDLIDVPWGGMRDDVRGDWDTLVGRVRRSDGTAIVCHEILAAATPEQVDRAMSAFSESEVHLVYSARDIARQIPAEWQEGIKQRRRRSFARFLTDVQESPRRGAKMWFWRVQGLPDVLSRWSIGLPPERVHLVTVPPQGAPTQVLWDRFCSAFGIDQAWVPQSEARGNESLGIAESTLLRRLNRRLGKGTLDRDDYHRLVRLLIVQDTLSRRQDMTRATLPPAMFPWANEVAEEWIEWVEGAGIDVVGDIDDLRPVAPPARQKWVNPDRPKRADVVDAAIDALAAMTKEAASRPDPDAQLTAKIGRATRRLRGQ